MKNINVLANASRIVTLTNVENIGTSNSKNPKAIKCDSGFLDCFFDEIHYFIHSYTFFAIFLPNKPSGLINTTPMIRKV